MIPQRKHTQKDNANEFVNSFFYKFGDGLNGLDFLPRKSEKGKKSPTYEDALALQSHECPSILVAKRENGVLCTCYTAKDGHKLVEMGFLPSCFMLDWSLM